MILSVKNLTLFASILVFLQWSCQPTTTVNRVHSFNSDWKFSLEEIEDGFNVNFNDQDWRTINLPHDWSVEFPFDSINGEGCTGYLPGGIGWYRKHFSLPQNENQVVSVLFDGVYNNSEVWINGKKLGNHPYGYSPFHYDLTPYLNKDGKENILAVKVDRSRYADSRWYPGSGIYRDVKLINAPKLHIPIWGTFITTPSVSDKQAEVKAEININNQSNEASKGQLLTQIFSPNGTKVSEITNDFEVIENAQSTITQNISIERPALWDTENPNQYQAISQIIQDGKVIDQYITDFGIRSFKFDKDKGFFLNGVNQKIKGVCLHHDAGLVGAAVPKDVWRRRLLTLKEGGCNAIRISHNPGSTEFLDLCDELGFLVQDEFFDEWDYPKDKRKNMLEQSEDYITRGYTEHFQEWAEKDLKNTVLSHRNHPSIIQWSIGNEIEWTYPKEAASTGFFDPNWAGNYFWTQPPNSIEKIAELQKTLPHRDLEIGTTAKKLSAWTKELDTTRPVIANCILPSASYESGYADALDIIGFSYRRVMYDYGHENYPDLPVMGTENLGQYHEWKAVMDRPFVAGTFLWTGIDYLGESNGGWPKKATSSGLLDLAGFKKPAYYMMKSLWSETPSIFMTTQIVGKSIFRVNKQGETVEKKPGGWKKALWGWHNVNQHWNYQTTDTVIVEILSNAEEVELFLNEKSLGKKILADFEDHIYKWAVPYSDGKLVAKGISNGQEVSTQLVTASEPTSISLEVDKTELNANGKDVSHIIVQLLDETGNPVKHIQKTIQFSVGKNLKILGVDNGSPRNVQPFQNQEITTDQGRAILIVQSTSQVGKSEIVASSVNLKSASLSIQIR